MTKDLRQTSRDPDLFKCRKTPSKEQRLYDELIKYVRDPDDAAYAAKALAQIGA